MYVAKTQNIDSYGVVFYSLTPEIVRKVILECNTLVDRDTLKVMRICSDTEQIWYEDKFDDFSVVDFITVRKEIS